MITNKKWTGDNFKIKVSYAENNKAFLKLEVTKQSRQFIETLLDAIIKVMAPEEKPNPDIKSPKFITVTEGYNPEEKENEK